MKLYEHIASLLDARRRCLLNGHKEWADKHTTRLTQIQGNLLPRGGGIDAGTTLHLEASNDKKIVFCTSFHHMNDQGCYDGWTEHKVVLRPAFVGGFEMKITGRDRNQIKDYLYDVFDQVLNEEVKEESHGTNE